MDQKRFIPFLFVAIPIYVGTLMYVSYQEQANRKIQPPPSVAGAVDGKTEQPSFAPSGEAPLSPTAPSDPSAGIPVASVRAPEDQPIKLRTDFYYIEFSDVGGVPIRWNIIDPAYVHPGVSKPKVEEGGEESQDGWIPLIDPELDAHGLDRPLELLLRETNARYYKELNQKPYAAIPPREENGFQVIEFESPKTESGLKLVKTYRFPQSGYQSSLTLRLINEGQSNLSFNDGGNGLGVALGPGVGRAPAGGGGSWFGGGNQYEMVHALYQSIRGVHGMSLGKEGETISDSSAQMAWAGIHSRYFLAAIWPDPQTAAGKGFTQVAGRLDRKVVEAALASDDTSSFYPRLELYCPAFTIPPGQELRFGYSIFAGPKERKTLQATPVGLDKILFHDSYGWMRSLCLGLMWMLRAFHGAFGNWGVAIIALVVTLRLATFPFTHIGMKHQAQMAKDMAKLKPHLDKINEKYKDDPSRKNTETMKLYREHNVNPLGMFKGCLWMFIQLPIFFALYKILAQSIDLRGATFLWIDDLSQPDRLFTWGFALPFLGTDFNLLPIFTSATQMLVSKLSMAANPAAMDNPMQKQMMYMMPVMVFVITYQFPSGLVLYWFISNVWQLLQQEFVNKKVLRPSPPPGAAA